MKAFGFLLICTAICIVGWLVTLGVVSEYAYDRDAGSYWSLADKASTIDRKSAYIDKFVAALAAQNLSDCNDALLLQTPDRAFDQNFGALKSLQSRLHEVRRMNPSSFQYQTAIQQITEQEQGQADAMLNRLSGCYFKTHYFPVWGGIPALLAFLALFLGIVGCGALATAYDW